jgi:hypothetical protein
MHNEIKDLNMGMFYKISDKQLLEDRNDLFKEVGITALANNDFVPSIFKSSWNGHYDKSIKGYIYEFTRMTNCKYLEIIEVYIISGEKWIQIYLNVFELFPKVNSINELAGFEGLPFGMTVKNKSMYMRLRKDDYKGPPIFYMTFLPEHKIGSYYSKSGYEAEITKLKKLIKSDMENIDSFVKRWHELNKPNITDWEGNVINKATE